MKPAAVAAGVLVAASGVFAAASIAVGSSSVLDVTTGTGTTTAPQILTGPPSILPPDVVVYPTVNAYAVVEPGCVWRNGTHTMKLSRKVKQWLAVANLGTSPHKLVEGAPMPSPMPLFSMQPHSSIGLMWKVPQTVTITTCSGQTKLTVTVTS